MTLNGQCMPVVLHFAKLIQMTKLLAINGRSVLERTPGCDVDFVQGTCSVLEYDCIAFDRMAAMHMLKLERIQYRCLRITLGLMQ
jgi:hypothetical protein